MINVAFPAPAVSKHLGIYSLRLIPAIAEDTAETPSKARLLSGACLKARTGIERQLKKIESNPVMIISGRA